jgi:hypothetical protein
LERARRVDWPSARGFGRRCLPVTFNQRLCEAGAACPQRASTFTREGIRWRWAEWTASSRRTRERVYRCLENQPTGAFLRGAQAPVGDYPTEQLCCGEPHHGQDVQQDVRQVVRPAGDAGASKRTRSSCAAAFDRYWRSLAAESFAIRAYTGLCIGHPKPALAEPRPPPHKKLPNSVLLTGERSWVVGHAGPARSGPRDPQHGVPRGDVRRLQRLLARPF